MAIFDFCHVGPVTGYFSSLYRASARNGSRNINGDLEYSEINTGTPGSFHTTRDLDVPDEFGMHYEVDCFSHKDAGDPSEVTVQYEEPGVVFTTSAAGKEMWTPVSLHQILLGYLL